MTPLEAVQLANTGVLLWTTVGPLLQTAMENGTNISMDDVDAAELEAGSDLGTLHLAIERKKLRDAAKS